MQKRIVFCAAGVCVMFLQSQPTSGLGQNGDSRWATFNPGKGEEEYRQVLPHVIDRSTESEVRRTSADEEKDEPTPRRGVLRLR